MRTAPNPMNSNPYAIEKICGHLGVEALESHLVFALMARMLVVAHNPKSKVGPCS